MILIASLAISLYQNRKKRTVRKHCIITFWYTEISVLISCRIKDRHLIQLSVIKMSPTSQHPMQSSAKQLISNKQTLVIIACVTAHATFTFMDFRPIKFLEQCYFADIYGMRKGFSPTEDFWSQI